MRNHTVPTVARFLALGLAAAYLSGAARAESSLAFDLGSMKSPLIASANVAEAAGGAPALTTALAPLGLDAGTPQVFSLATTGGSPYGGQSRFSPPFTPVTPEPVTTVLAASGLGIALLRVRRSR